MQEVQKADPDAWRWAATIVLVALGSGLAGLATMRDTKVVTGPGAALSGRSVQALCVGLTLCALAVPAVPYRLFSVMGRAL